MIEPPLVIKHFLEQLSVKCNHCNERMKANEFESHFSNKHTNITSMNISNSS